MTTLRIEITDEMRKKLEGLHDAGKLLASAAGHPIPTLAQIVTAVLEKGAALEAGQKPPPGQRPLLTMSVEEFAELMGMTDLQAAREAGAKQKAEAERVLQKTQEILGDCADFRAGFAPIRIQGDADLTNWVNHCKSIFAEHPSATIKVCWVISDPINSETAFGMPNPGGVQ